jgi:hypothetical protein
LTFPHTNLGLQNAMLVCGRGKFRADMAYFK